MFDVGSIIRLASIYRAAAEEVETPDQEMTGGKDPEFEFTVPGSQALPEAEEISLESLQAKLEEAEKKLRSIPYNVKNVFNLVTGGDPSLKQLSGLIYEYFPPKEHDDKSLDPETRYARALARIQSADVIMSMVASVEKDAKNIAAIREEFEKQGVPQNFIAEIFTRQPNEKYAEGMNFVDLVHLYDEYVDRIDRELKKIDEDYTPAGKKPAGKKPAGKKGPEAKPRLRTFDPSKEDDDEPRVKEIGSFRSPEIEELYERVREVAGVIPEDDDERLSEAEKIKEQIAKLDEMTAPYRASQIDIIETPDFLPSKSKKGPFGRLPRERPESERGAPIRSETDYSDFIQNYNRDISKLINARRRADRLEAKENKTKYDEETILSLKNDEMRLLTEMLVNIVNAYEEAQEAVSKGIVERIPKNLVYDISRTLRDFESRAESQDIPGRFFDQTAIDAVEKAKAIYENNRKEFEAFNKAEKKRKELIARRDVLLGNDPEGAIRKLFPHQYNQAVSRLEDDVLKEEEKEEREEDERKNRLEQIERINKDKSLSRQEKDEAINALNRTLTQFRYDEDRDTGFINVRGPDGNWTIKSKQEIRDQLKDVEKQLEKDPLNKNLKEMRDRLKGDIAAFERPVYTRKLSIPAALEKALNEVEISLENEERKLKDAEDVFDKVSDELEALMLSDGEYPREKIEAKFKERGAIYSEIYKLKVKIDKLLERRDQLADRVGPRREVQSKYEPIEPPAKPVDFEERGGILPTSPFLNEVAHIFEPILDSRSVKEGTERDIGAGVTRSVEYKIAPKYTNLPIELDEYRMLVTEFVPDQEWQRSGNKFVRRDLRGEIFQDGNKFKAIYIDPSTGKDVEIDVFNSAKEAKDAVNAAIKKDAIDTIEWVGSAAVKGQSRRNDGLAVVNRIGKIIPADLNIKETENGFIVTYNRPDGTVRELEKIFSTKNEAEAYRQEILKRNLSYKISIRDKEGKFVTQTEKYDTEDQAKAVADDLIARNSSGIGLDGLEPKTTNIEFIDGDGNTVAKENLRKIFDVLELPDPLLDSLDNLPADQYQAYSKIRDMFDMEFEHEVVSRTNRDGDEYQTKVPKRRETPGRLGSKAKKVVQYYDLIPKSGTGFLPLVGWKMTSTFIGEDNNMKLTDVEVIVPEVRVDQSTGKKSEVERKYTPRQALQKIVTSTLQFTPSGAGPKIVQKGNKTIKTEYLMPQPHGSNKKQTSSAAFDKMIGPYVDGVYLRKTEQVGDGPERVTIVYEDAEGNEVPIEQVAAHIMENLPSGFGTTTQPIKRVKQPVATPANTPQAARERAELRQKLLERAERGSKEEQKAAQRGLERIDRQEQEAAKKLEELQNAAQQGDVAAKKELEKIERQERFLNIKDELGFEDETGKYESRLTEDSGSNLEGDILLGYGELADGRPNAKVISVKIHRGSADGTIDPDGPVVVQFKPMDDPNWYIAQVRHENIKNLNLKDIWNDLRKIRGGSPELKNRMFNLVKTVKGKRVSPEGLAVSPMSAKTDIDERTEEQRKVMDIEPAQMLSKILDGEQLTTTTKNVIRGKYRAALKQLVEDASKETGDVVEANQLPEEVIVEMVNNLNIGNPEKEQILTALRLPAPQMPMRYQMREQPLTDEEREERMRQKTEKKTSDFPVGLYTVDIAILPLSALTVKPTESELRKLVSNHNNWTRLQFPNDFSIERPMSAKELAKKVIDEFVTPEMNKNKDIKMVKFEGGATPVKVSVKNSADSDYGMKLNLEYQVGIEGAKLVGQTTQKKTKERLKNREVAEPLKRRTVELIIEYPNPEASKIESKLRNRFDPEPDPETGDLTPIEPIPSEIIREKITLTEDIIDSDGEVNRKKFMKEIIDRATGLVRNNMAGGSGLPGFFFKLPKNLEHGKKFPANITAINPITGQKIVSFRIRFKTVKGNVIAGKPERVLDPADVASPDRRKPTGDKKKRQEAPEKPETPETTDESAKKVNYPNPVVHLAKYRWMGSDANDATINIAYNSVKKRDQLIDKFEKSSGVRISRRPVWLQRIDNVASNFDFEEILKGVMKNGAVPVYALTKKKQ